MSDQNQNNSLLPEEIKREYPFQNHFYQLPSGQRIHYLDEGQKNYPVVVMVHGNPTWSFFYRHLVKALKDQFRIIVPDHLGCGLSDKPQDHHYCLDNHITNLKSLLHHLEVKHYHLIVHDWGGAIGLGLAGQQKEREGKTVILNTAAFIDQHISRRIAFCRLPLLGEKIIRHCNAFAWPATFMAVEKPLPRHIKKGFLWPYRDYQSRIATARFVQDIPMKETHPSYSTLKKVEENLVSIQGKKLILWGMKDFCFTPHFFKRWTHIYPEAQTKLFYKAGHYLLEDEKDAVVKEIIHFL